ncbi:MAG: glycosyltransferase family 4 protein [Candidatus Omnitrophica bacterium]|nr:glycosyltransferase family 4 protein [Candidatus Omnitrophota bacterium]
MRILLIHPHDIFSPSEPWTRRIRAFAKEFTKSGHEVKLVYFPSADSNTGNKEPAFPVGYEVISLSRSQSPVIFIKNIIEITKLAKWSDVVHFQKCHHYAALPAVIASYITGKHLHYDWDDWEEQIWYESCGESAHSLFIGSFFKILERVLPLLSDTLSVSSSCLRDLALGFGVSEKNIYLAPVGADPEEFDLNLDGSEIRKKYNIASPLILYVGQLHGAQYIDLFIKAANIILHNEPGVKFMIVGKGFMEESLKRLTFELGINDKVIFTGSVPHDEIPQYIAAADICVAPFKDTKAVRCKSPLKIVEYMAMGKPVVASSVGEARIMLGGVGVMVSPGDYRALAGGISRLLKDNVLKENLGIFARKRIEKKYNWRNISSCLVAAYKNNAAEQ